MKKIVLVLMVALMGTVVMNAQPPRGAGMMVKDRVEQLTQVLGLDEIQQAKVADIIQEGAKQMNSDRMSKADVEKADKTDKTDKVDRQSRHERMRSLHAAIDARIAEVLTPEQQEKFKQFRQEEMKREGRGSFGPKDRRQHQKPMKSPKEDCCKDNKSEGCCDQPKGDVEKPNTVEGE